MANFPLSVFNGPPSKMTGLDSVDDSVRQLFTVVDVMQAFNTEWKGDAHFTCYSVVGEEVWPRINKPALPGLLRKGGVVEANLIALDYDHNLNVSEDVLRGAGWDGGVKRPKVRWTASRHREFAGSLHSLRSTFEDKSLAFPSVIYFTEHGARFVHFLSEGVPVQDVEPLIRGMMKAYEDAGIIMDPACKDWTRFYRLPKVMRRDEPTWTKDYYNSIEEDSWLVPQAIEPVGKAQALDYIEVPELDIDQPTAEEARALVEGIKGKVLRKTAVYRRAKERLFRRGADHCHDVIVHNAPIAPDGGRYIKLLELIGQAVCHLYDVEGTTPEFVYGLFLPSVEQLEPDEKRPDWCATAWDMIKRIWRKEKGREEFTKQIETTRTAQKANDLLTLLEIVRGIYPRKKLLHDEDDNVALMELRRMGIVMTSGDNFHVMQPDGFYMRDRRSAIMLAGTIYDQGMEFLMQLQEPGDRGVQLNVGSGDLLRYYGRQASRVVGLACLDGAVMTPEGVLQIPLYKRADRRPIFHEEVDVWLRHATTREDYKRLMKWLAYSLDFEGGPICALVLTGLPDVGKKLISRGLSECIEGSPQPGSGEDVVGQYTPALLQTPFIVVDEGLPVERFAKRTAADQFRRMVSGEGMRIDQKYLAPVEVRSPVRILFTANNPDIAFGLLTGLPDVGKKLISRGLSECIEGSPQPGSGEDVVGQYTPALLQTPFIVVDEGLPVERFAKRTAADQFRRMVSGEGMRIDQKYLAPVEVRSPVRILFTANNPDIAFGLVGARTMTKHDRLAIGQRLLHIPLQPEAASHLRAKGGRRHTAGWIAGDSGTQSDYIIAEHFMYLYENRVELFGDATTDRFLVEGNLKAEIIEDMRALSGVSPEVTEVCIYLVETTEHLEQIKRQVARGVDDNNEPAIYVTTSAVITFYKEHGKFDKQKNLNHRNVGIAMEQVAERTSDSGEKRVTLAGKDSNRVRWWKLDLEFLLRYARKHGLACSKLEHIIEPEPEHDQQVRQI